jgi:SOS-response transcriptional repressor LexA
MLETRPSKKQRELLSFIDGFIKGNGYGPSYREIMRALDYKSVSTVAVHVDGLIARGLLRKKDNSARSLEVVAAVVSATDPHIKWLQKEIKKREGSDVEQAKKDIAVLKQALAILDTSKE